MYFVDQKDAETRFDKCPRTLLVQALERLEKRWGARVLTGFETELVLLDDANNVIKPMDRLNGYDRTAGLRAGTLDLVEENVDTLGQSSIDVHHFHAELGDQLEIALAHEPAMQAVDSLVLAREAIRTVCLHRNLKATMTPKPILASGMTSGLHLHLSLDKLEGSLPDHLLAGILAHVGSLCAFGMANYDGYARAVGDAAGVWVGFGTDNRDLPVRMINKLHWKLRTMGSISNPYLFTAVNVLAGIDGLERKTDLVWKDCKFFPHLMNEQRRIDHGISQRMPVTFKEALDLLRRDDEV